MERTDGGSLTVLVTGFGPFPGARFNPTAELERRLVRLRRPGLAGVRRIDHVFRVSYAAVEAELPALIERHRPDVVLMFGLAARTPHIRVETCARNARSPLFPDAAGRKAAGQSIVRGGPSRLPGRAPFERLVVAVRARRVPVRRSHNAGRYLCNFAYWRALESKAPLVLFVHVPKLGQAARPRRPGRRRAMTAGDLEWAGEAILRILSAEARQERARGRPRVGQLPRYES